jgi:hypothetical protein
MGYDLHQKSVVKIIMYISKSFMTLLGLKFKDIQKGKSILLGWNLTLVTEWTDSKSTSR